jgi:hypothetical protein
MPPIKSDLEQKKNNYWFYIIILTPVILFTLSIIGLNTLKNKYDKPKNMPPGYKALYYILLITYIIHYMFFACVFMYLCKVMFFG